MSIECRTTRACVIPRTGEFTPRLHRASPYMYITTDRRARPRNPHACRKRRARGWSMPRRLWLAPSLEICRGETDSRGTALRPAMSERDGPGLDGIFRRAFAEALADSLTSSRDVSDSFLWLSQPLLPGPNLILGFAALMHLIAGRGSENP